MFDKPQTDPSFPELEREILEMWRERDIFARSIRGDRDFVFYDGPPFATGTPHYGHLLAGTLKDIVPRYWTMRGYKVERRFGWDTHGLPVEMEIEKQLGLQGPGAVREYGIDRYNEACRSIVLRYTGEWRGTVERLGRWVDFDDDYKTMDPTFMESVWWVFRQLWDKGLIYQGYKVMPYSWRLGTPLSNFEANMDYRTVQDPAITVTFPVAELPGHHFLAWTTTPWTLPANMALCVGPTVQYAFVRKDGAGPTYILAAALVESVLGAGWTVEKTVPGEELVGLHYTPVFDFFADAAAEGAFRVVMDDYVGESEGTGIVHQAPAFGEDDWRICEREGIPLRDPIDDEGRFTAEVAIAAGVQVKEADKTLIRDLKDRGRLVKHATIDHEYPFCWRSGTPLIYKAMPTWFVRVTDIRERMVELNRTSRWVPETLGTGRFENWLKDARDWAISRNRFWGTPLPVWVCDRCDRRDCIGAIAELEAKSGATVTDLHKHHVDDLTWSCEVCDGTMRRISEVLDCWFESGSMPYAQNHYPFENRELVEQNLPAHFIAEGLDQTRGWFYTLLILSTALFDRPAFQNVIVNGMILAEDGRKMSKRLKNYPDPNYVVDEYGADALRAYLINSPVVRAQPMRFSEKGLREVVRAVVLPLWNAYSFFATYASVDGWAPPATPSPVAERSLLDRWVVSMIQSLIDDVNREMEAYRLYAVIPAVLGFIDHLTNWYIRRSRRRFWKAESDTDKQHAFETLYEVLTTFSRLLAPILPFMAEVLFQRLEAGKRPGAEDSVHLEAFPMADRALVDADLERWMAVVREAVGLGRNLREKHRLRVRQPLASLVLASPEPLTDELLAIIGEELNIKAVTRVADAAELVTLSAKPNFKVLGRKLGKKMKVVAKAIQALDTATVTAIRDGGSVEIEGEVIDASGILVVQGGDGEGATASTDTLTVQLDTTVTPSLRREGLARELISKIQAERKARGLEVEDRIVLCLQTQSAELLAAIDAHDELICDETLTVERRTLDIAHTATQADTEDVAIALVKA